MGVLYHVLLMLSKRRVYLHISKKSIEYPYLINIMKTWKKITLALLVLILAATVGLFVYKSEYKINKNFGQESAFFQNHQFRLGLDLSGGSHLVYKADVSAVDQSQVEDSMNALRDVIERRVNLFGVSEPVVQIEGGQQFTRISNCCILPLFHNKSTVIDKRNYLVVLS
jgi:hypothetical protein